MVRSFFFLWTRIPTANDVPHNGFSRQRGRRTRLPAGGAQTPSAPWAAARTRLPCRRVRLPHGEAARARTQFLRELVSQRVGRFSRMVMPTILKA